MSIAIGIERIIFGDISKGIDYPNGNQYSSIGKYFHEMHARASSQNESFHPIAACIQAVTMGIFCSIMANLVIQIIPKIFRNNFRIGLEGGSWIYAGSIIHTAATEWVKGARME